MIRAVLTAVTVLVALPAAAAVKIQEVTSPGGISAWLVEEPSIPFVALELRFKGGASLDLPGKRGATNLMTGLLEEGAGPYDSTGFAVQRESLATRIEFDVYDDALSISQTFLTENRDEAVELLRLALTETRFEQSAIDRVRGQIESSIRSRTTDPDDIASDAFNALAFGEHPYGTDLNGTLESIAALTQEDIFEARDRVIARDRVVVSAVGDIDAETLGQVLDSILADLPETGAPLPGRVEFGVGGGVTVVDFDTPQSVVIFGHSGIKRSDPDFFPAFVMTQILGGGGFNSRLMSEVREKRGLTYGIGAYLYPMDLSEMMLGQVRTVNARVGETVDVVRAEWERLATEGVTEEELERAKTYLTGAYPLRFDGNQRIANILAGMQLDDLGADYIDTRNDKVNAVTLEQIKDVAARLVRPDDLHFVVVGKPEGVEATN